jgi:hypothetical protein
MVDPLGKAHGAGATPQHCHYVDVLSIRRPCISDTSLHNKTLSCWTVVAWGNFNSSVSGYP